MAKGGSMKGTKYMAKGGAALMGEMKANPGMGNMPNSVKQALMGGGVRGKAQANMLKGTKGMAKGGGMKKGTKYMAKGGGMMSGLGKGIKNIVK